MILLHRRGLVLPLKRLHINIGQVHTWLLSGLAACCAVNTMGFSIHESTRNRCVLKWLMQESFKNSSPVLILWVGTDMGKLGDHRCGWHYTFCLVPAFPGSWTALTRWKKRKIQFRFWKISWRSVRKPKLWSRCSVLPRAISPAETCVRPPHLLYNGCTRGTETKGGFIL